ncbi:centrosomal protein of 131 kDa [Mobula birostris]|uniref:centrosomal protein of 131 kDa n=1 Tax=Mobula birostris TaxID=1983395 RepID=UPI003B28794C
MNSSRSSSSFLCDGFDLSLTGSQLSITKRPSSASPAKQLARSTSVSSENKSKANLLGDAGRGNISGGNSRAINNLRRSNSTTQVNQKASATSSEERTDDFLALFDSSADGRKKLSSLSKASSEKRTTWNVLDEEPRVFPIPVSGRSSSSTDVPVLSKRRELGVALAANFTANNRSNKGTVGNSVTTMLHNNYSTVDKPLTPKSSNQKATSLNLQKDHLDVLQCFWDNVLWTDETKVELLGRNEYCCLEGEGNCTPTPKSHHNCEAWWKEHHGLWLLCCLRAWTTCNCPDTCTWPASAAPHVAHRAASTFHGFRDATARHMHMASLSSAPCCSQSRFHLPWIPRRHSPTHANMIKVPTHDENSLDQNSLKKSQKNFSSNNVATRNNTSTLNKKKEVTEEEAERFIQHVSHAAITIQRWYRRHFQRRRAGQAALKRLLAAKKQEKEQEVSTESMQEYQRRKSEDRRKIREEKARQARKAAIQELQQKREEKAAEDKRISEEEVAALRERAKVLKRKATKTVPINNTSPVHSQVKSRNSAVDLEVYSNQRTETSVGPGMKTEELQNHSQDMILRETPVEEQETMTLSVSHSKTTLNDVLDTLKLLEEEPELLPETKVYKKDKYAWIDEDCDSTSLTADNLEKLGQIEGASGRPEDGTLLSEAKLKSIMSFLDEMENSEQERPISRTSVAHREGLLSEEEQAHLEQASLVATEVTSSMIKLKLECEEKKRAVAMLQTALTQQRELTARHVKETEKEMSQRLRAQKEQYESTIQRHLTFIDQLIDDKKGLNEKCESVVNELKQVDQKYTKKIQQMQDQHDLEIKKLKELMSATEKIRREKWIDEKTKKIKEITVKGLEPEIQKLIAKHKQEIKKLKALHEAELAQSDERAARRYIRQTEELREQLEKEKDDLCQRERDLARQRYEKQLEQEEQAIQQQRRRMYAEVSEEKERLNLQAARQRAELDELRSQLEENCSLVTKALKEEFEKAKEEQERRHQAEIQSLKERLEIEKQAWEENYMKKQEAWLLTRERGLKEEVRKGRDKEIELVIQRLEEEVRVSKQECERAAENTIKHVRHKYETELRELEHSERNLQERCNEFKAQLMEAEGETIRFKGLLKYKEQEIEDIRKIKDRLTEERNSLAEVIRQEFADRLVSTEEENKRLKTEMLEMRARHRLEIERVTKEKEEELEEVHKRVKAAIVKKEETVNNLRKQHEATLKRADHLEALLEQQRKQLLGK